MSNGTRFAAIRTGRSCRACRGIAPKRSWTTFPTSFCGRLLFPRYRSLEPEFFEAFASVLFEFREQPLVSQIKLVGVLPVVVHNFLQAIDDVLVTHFDGQFAPAVKAAGRQV